MQSENKTVVYELEASEFDWQLRPGKTVKAWGFNKQVPGPQLNARKGDTLVVKVKNSLNEPTIVHWHGIRLPAAMDGTGETQKPILPGETYEYRFVVPDSGTFWYHSHYNETLQMERGMYGGIVVAGKDDPTVDAERLLLIDDMRLTDTDDHEERNKLGKWIERHDGREGNTRLINGKEVSTFHMHAGQTERWRMVNAASARYFLLNLGGKPFKVIGTDGGLLERPIEKTELLITPGERYDILVGPFNEGDNIAIENLGYNRTTFLKPRRETYAQLHVGTEKDTKLTVPARLCEIPRLATATAVANRSVKLSVAPSLKNILDFHVNGQTHCNDQPVKVGDLQVWEVSNTSLMDHPFHLHGFFFQVIEENGKVPEYLAWKDTYNLKPKTKIKIAWIADDRPGKWMYHCHILEHHAAGMMAHFEVVRPGQQPMRHTDHNCGSHSNAHPHKTKNLKTMTANM
ncbi:MAG: multicopper oxidase family protein [Bacteroidetes bacterium]|nr:multicopper oxidase family protein [Bacteroidota bacterium]